MHYNTSQAASKMATSTFGSRLMNHRFTFAAVPLPSAPTERTRELLEGSTAIMDECPMVRTQSTRWEPAPFQKKRIALPNLWTFGTGRVCVHFTFKAYPQLPDKEKGYPTHANFPMSGRMRTMLGALPALQIPTGRQTNVRRMDSVAPLDNVGATVAAQPTVIIRPLVDPQLMEAIRAMAARRSQFVTMPPGFETMEYSGTTALYRAIAANQSRFVTVPPGFETEQYRQLMAAALAMAADRSTPTDPPPGFGPLIDINHDGRSNSSPPTTPTERTGELSEGSTTDDGYTGDCELSPIAQESPAGRSTASTLPPGFPYLINPSRDGYVNLPPPPTPTERTRELLEDSTSDDGSASGSNFGPIARPAKNVPPPPTPTDRMTELLEGSTSDDGSASNSDCGPIARPAKRSPAIDVDKSGWDSDDELVPNPKSPKMTNPFLDEGSFKGQGKRPVRDATDYNLSAPGPLTPPLPIPVLPYGPVEGAMWRRTADAMEMERSGSPTERYTERRAGRIMQRLLRSMATLNMTAHDAEEDEATVSREANSETGELGEIECVIT